MTPPQKETKMTFSVEGEVNGRYVFAAFGILAAATRLLQVRLEFSGIAYPFVFACRAVHNGTPVEYLALPPLGDEHVYLLPAQDERFLPDTATHLRIEGKDTLIEAVTIQEGSELQQLEVVRWELQDWPKHPAEHIWLRRDEGGYGWVEFDREKTDNIWKSANQQLAAWARTAPSDGSSHRVTYQVDYGAGKYKFLGHYNLRSHDTKLANLGRILCRWAARPTGRWSIPLSPLSPDYSPAKAHQLVAEHDEWLEKIAGHSTGGADRYIWLLAHGELLDDPSVEPGGR